MTKLEDWLLYKLADMKVAGDLRAPYFPAQQNQLNQLIAAKKLLILKEFEIESGRMSPTPLEGKGAVTDKYNQDAKNIKETQIKQKLERAKR